MNKRAFTFRFLTLFFLILGILMTGCACRSTNIQEKEQAGRPACIDPDYSGTVLPPNIAPVNFRIRETGQEYRIEIQSLKGRPVLLHSKNGDVTIPVKAWKDLLFQNKGQDLHFRITVRNEGRWIEFDPVTNHIAKDAIDPFLVYRLIQPMYYYWGKMGLYQRNLENYQEKPLLLNRAVDRACMNCHAFCNHDPGKMMFHMRSQTVGGLYLVRQDKVDRINTKTPFNPGAAVYPAWHPNGKIIAFSLNKLRQYFHAVGENREVIDHASDLILYFPESNTVTTCPEIANPDIQETFPAWSPDGQYLYFCSAAQTPSIHNYHHVKYDLTRIEYHPDTGVWGTPETLLSSAKTDQSALLPRISPDGQHLLFCMVDHGNFPAFIQDCNLYLMNLKNRKVRELEHVNSPCTDSYHTWSSNSRWFVFSSKRRDNVCALPYICHVDEQGAVSKPFLLPQKNPQHYDFELMTYNLPELIQSPVKLNARQVARKAFDEHSVINAVLDPQVPVPERKGEHGQEDQAIPL